MFANVTKTYLQIWQIHVCNRDKGIFVDMDLYDIGQFRKVGLSSFYLCAKSNSELSKNTECGDYYFFVHNGYLVNFAHPLQVFSDPENCEAKNAIFWTMPLIFLSTSCKIFCSLWTLRRFYKWIPSPHWCCYDGFKNLTYKCISK